jgi:hypothetical protein
MSQPTLAHHATKHPSRIDSAASSNDHAHTPTTVSNITAEGGHARYAMYWSASQSCAMHEIIIIMSMTPPPRRRCCSFWCRHS